MSEEEKHIEVQSKDGNPKSTENNITVYEQSTINHLPQTENMEVHKHPHHVTHKKKWNEYLLEFFMLFLAVFWALLRKMSESQQRNLRFNDARLLRTKKLATELIKDIKKEYHLEDE